MANSAQRKENIGTFLRRRCVENIGTFLRRRCVPSLVTPILIICLSLPVSSYAKKTYVQEEEDLFQVCTQLYRQDTLNKTAAIAAFEKFLDRYPRSSKAADAQFMVGESHMDRAVELLKAEQSAKHFSEARMMGGKNITAEIEFSKAISSFKKVISRHKKSGLAGSAQYRIGEIHYNQGDWELAAKAFETVGDKYSKSYLVPESLLGIVYSNIALNRYSEAESAFFNLVETYPNYTRNPGVLFAKGILAMNRGDYSNARKSLSLVNTPQARFYLGRNHMYHGKPYLAASVLEKLTQDYPGADTEEETQFLIGDAFFRAGDYEGAVSKYQRFMSKYADSKFKVAAMFRVGACMFRRKDYVSARNYFQSVLDKYPGDFFAPLSQYFVAESYLVNGEFRDALFAYTRVMTQYPNVSSVSYLAHYKLAWCQYKVGDYSQAVETSQKFLARYPAHELSKNIYLIIANCLLLQKEYAGAIQAFQSIIDLSPSSEIAEQAFFLILKTQYEKKNYNTILTSYQYMFKRFPPSQSKWRALSYLYVAQAYLAVNLVDEAQAFFDMVMRVYPNEPAALYAQDELTWCYAFRGEYESAVKARQRLQEMISAAPSSRFTLNTVNAIAIADSMFNRKEYEQAYQAYEKFESENEGTQYAASALYRAGLALYSMRYYTQSVEVWEKLIRSYPEAPQTQTAEYQIADTYFRAQKYSQAVSAYRGIIKKHPKSKQIPLAYLRIAQAAYNAKNDKGAVSQSVKVVEQFPDSPEAADALDLLEAVFDRSPGTDYKTILANAVAANPHSRITGEIQFRLGRRCFENKDYSGAIEELKKFSVDYTAHKSLAKSQFYLGEAYFQSGKLDQAIPAFKRLVENYPGTQETPLALFRLGSSHYDLKNYDSASKSYQRLLDSYPESEYIKPALFNLALSYKSTGKTDLAQETYRRYHKMSVEAGGPVSQVAMWEIYNLQKVRGDFAGALDTLGRIYSETQGTQDSLEALYHMGEIHMKSSLVDEAKKSWEKLVALRPLKSPYRLQALIKLGEVYEKEDEYSTAAALYKDLARNAPPEIARAARQRSAALKEKAAKQSPGGSSKKRKGKAVSKPKKSGELDLPGMLPGTLPGMREEAVKQSHMKLGGAVKQGPGGAGSEQ